MDGRIELQGWILELNWRDGFIPAEESPGERSWYLWRLVFAPPKSSGLFRLTVVARRLIAWCTLVSLSQSRSRAWASGLHPHIFRYRGLAGDGEKASPVIGGAMHDTEMPWECR